MKNITDLLVEEGIRRCVVRENKIRIVAEAVSKFLDTSSEGILYELEVANALANLRERGFSLTETETRQLSKPAKNSHYGEFRVNFTSLREAIVNISQDVERTNIIEVRYKFGTREDTTQQAGARIIFYKDHEKLKQYIGQRTSPSRIVLYDFEVPELLTKARTRPLRKK